MRSLAMRNLIFLPLLLLAAPAFGQEADLPPATLPAPDANVDAVLAPVRALFAGIAAHDPALITPYVVEGATMTIADSTSGATTTSTVAFSEWITQLPLATERYEERMPNPVVDTDGDIAMVWGFYTFHRDGAFSHCGADHFSLVREDGGWKIANLAFSRRITDCGE